MKPVKAPFEELSTQAKVQVVAFLHECYNISPLCHFGKEWGYVAWRHCTNDTEELMKYVKTDAYRLTFGKCADVEATLKATDGGPLVFQGVAPLSLIQRACKVGFIRASSLGSFLAGRYASPFHS